MRFEGKVLFTTGAGSGLAEAVARRFSARGAGGGARSRRRQGRSGGRRPRGIDRAPARRRGRGVGRSRRGGHDRRLGRIDCVFNAAGHADFGPIEEWSLERWNRMLGVHAGGTFLCCKHTLPHLRAAGGGSIVNVASIAAITAQPFNAPYGAAKAAIVGFTRQLSRDVAPDVRVNAVAPDRITGMTTRSSPAAAAATREGEAFAIPGSDAAGSASPRDRGAVCFLLSDEASFITGTLIVARRRRDVDMRRVTVDRSRRRGPLRSLRGREGGRPGHRPRGRREDRRHDGALGRQRLVPGQPSRAGRHARARPRLPAGTLRSVTSATPSCRCSRGRRARPSTRIERETPVAWQSIAYSDYHAEFEGGREQGGRTLEPLPIDPFARVAALDP